MPKHVGPTDFTRFRATAPFQFRLSVFDERFRQGPDGSLDYYTRNKVMRGQVLAAGGPVRVMAENIRFPALPPQEWRRAFAGERVLFLSPSDALGDCVGIILFLRAFRRAHPQASVTVANTGAATDMFGREGVRVLPLVLSAKELRSHTVVIDLGDAEGWDKVAVRPVDIEGVLLRQFGLDPVPVPPRRVGPAPNIAILPMATSPLRTLPVPVVAALAAAFADEGEVRVVLNAYQGVKGAYDQALRAELGASASILPGFQTTGALLDFLAGQDFVLAPDSGPANITKLFGTPGVNIFTSNDGAVLQGRHRNLLRWQTAYQGRHCTAPCGLAKLRATADGRIGCMESLGVALDQLPGMPSQAQAAAAERLTLADHVPCVRALIDRRGDLSAAALEYFREARRS